MLRDWEKLPEYMKTEAVRPYYEKLQRKKRSLVWKRVFDFVLSSLLLAVLLPVMVLIAFCIAADSKGGVFFRQERITRYGRKFKILKFRTMVANAEKLGPQVTGCNDWRITGVGRVLRKYRLDELPQLVNIMLGDMTFCGTRPEVERYVKKYTPEMMATLLLPAGLTSQASIRYRKEGRRLEGADDVDEVYINQVLPEKMKYNLQCIRAFSLRSELAVLFWTLAAVCGKG